jgi:predicted transposase/invertase (TIGR01784 family)
MANFKKAESELSGHLEWWLYFLRELVTFDEVPTEFQGDIIENAFELAKLANMSYEDRHAYELSLKYYRDFINVIDTAKKEGKEEGREEGEKKGKREAAKVLKENNVDLSLIMAATGLSAEEIEQL